MSGAHGGEAGQCACGREHRTREINLRKGSLADRLLSVVVMTTCDRDRAVASKYPYREMTYEVPGYDFIAYEYVLTVLSLLHRWFGVVRNVREEA